MTASAKTATRPAATGTAYADDVYTWTLEQGARLQAGDFDALDLENLAQEIESSGKSQFSSLVSAWRVVLLHRPRFDHQPSRRTMCCAFTIVTQRIATAYELEDSQGLKSRQDEAMERAYDRARLEAARETRLPLKTFPETCSYTREEMPTRPLAIDPDDTTA